MPNGNPRSIQIVEGGYCPDTRYEEQHKALEEARGLWTQCYHTAYNHRTIWVTISHYLSRCSKDRYRAWTCEQSYIQIACTLCFDISQDSYIQESTREGKDRQNQTEQA